MKLDEKMSKVVAELEYRVGRECYNPNSYDGWNDIEGCDFRYPLSFPDSEGHFTKVRGNVNNYYGIESEDVNPDTVPYMKYKFGSNELMIGRGLINVLNYLEDRYDISFNDLENGLEE